MLTIKSVEGEKFEDREKPVLSFNETEKKLILNRTNTNTLAQLYGNETEHWPGKQIEVFTTQVDFRGQPTMAVRVSLERPSEVRITDDSIPF